MAAAFSAIAVLHYAVHADAMKERYHVNLLTVVATYVLGGAMGGLLVGLLLPMTRTRVGAGALGVVALMPLAAMIQYATMGATHWRPEDTVVIVIGSIMLGVPLGLSEYEEASHVDSKRDKGRPAGH